MKNNFKNISTPLILLMHATDLPEMKIMGYGHTQRVRGKNKHMFSNTSLKRSRYTFIAAHVRQFVFVLASDPLSIPLPSTLPANRV